MGSLEYLMRDPDVNDIPVNGPSQICVERRGKLQRTDAHFRSDDHLFHVAHRICASIGRRIDEQSPMLDARLPDGSRVNVIIPPVSLKGVCMSIRRFSRQVIDFKCWSNSAARRRRWPAFWRSRPTVASTSSFRAGPDQARRRCSTPCRYRSIPTNKIITVEDVAELQLQQPHVIPLETRPPNIEGHGQIVQRDLVRNAMRMRPDRIIVGEVRGAEAFDMLPAMNTGHAGSMSTIHANSAADAISRIENMVMMANVGLPARAILGQIFSAVDLIIQIERMRDGVRRIVEVCEPANIENDTVALRELFQYRFIEENEDGKLIGAFEPAGVRPHFTERLSYYGLDKEFMALLTPSAAA